jgi:hypothetical protein
MINFMIAVYRAIPWRPHCGNGTHTRLCSLAGPMTRKRCEFELPIPD